MLTLFWHGGRLYDATCPRCQAFLWGTLAGMVSK
jgi:hypothetical protein